MDNHSAVESLQVIRLLMERSALYRRAIAPIMLVSGTLGVVAAFVGIVWEIRSVHAFCQFWLATGCIGIALAYLIARRQALRASEPFWSPPTRRISAAMLPPMLVGGCVGLGMFQLENGDAHDFIVVTAYWIALYGCALLGAAQFTPIGLRVFGWIFVVPGCAAIPLLNVPPAGLPAMAPHLVMGLWFGVFHLMFGAYLYRTEKGAPPA